MNKRRQKPRRRVYANRNRAWNTRQNTFALTLKTTGIILTFAIVGVMWLVARHAKDSLYDEIKAEESRQFALEEEVRRETVKWNNAKTPARITTALARHGIRMDLPRRAQYVAVRTLRTSGPAAVKPATAWAANR